jgi:hypothetical protein
MESDLDVVRRRHREVRSLLDPAWRYTRARALKSDGVRRFRSTEDRWVTLLTSFLHAWDESTIENREEVEDQYPDLHWAFQLHSAEMRGPRYHLEALIVASMPLDEVANYLDLPDAVVLAYEACFFDMRRHLDKAGAVKAYITARAKARGLRDMHPDPFWKRIALAEGSIFLFTLWDDGIMEPDDRRRFDDLLASQARRNATEAMRVRDINPMNAHEIVEEWVAIFKNEIDRQRVETEMGLGGDVVQEFVAGLVHAVQFSIAPVGAGSEQAYIEMTAAVAQGPAVLRRLQGASQEKKHVEVPEPDSS